MFNEKLKHSFFQRLMKNSGVVATTAEMSVPMFPSFDHCSCAGEQKECALKLCCSARQGNAVAVKVEANVFKVILSIQGLDKLEARLKHACVFLKTPGISCTIYSCTFGALSCFWLQLSYGLSE